MSREAASLGGASFVQRYLAAKYPGTALPNEPQSHGDSGAEGLPSLASIPDVPDLLMIAVRADLVLASLEE